MYTYTILKNDNEVYNLLKKWKVSNCNLIGVDFEGEFNLHVYGEHLCLIQIFDNTDFYIIDPFLVSKDALKAFLESDWLQKIWFDCSSDGNLVWKNYKIKIKNIFDVYLVAKLLGISGNLSFLINYFKLNKENTTTDTTAKNEKKKNQKTNWLKRPLDDEQISYALSDVAYLFSLKDLLEKETDRQQKRNALINIMKIPLHIKTEIIPGYEKLPRWQRLTQEQKTFAKYFYEARDAVAQKLNKPAFMILDKHVLVDIACKVPQNEIHFKIIAGNNNQKIESLFIPLLLKAKEKAISEINSTKEN